MPPASRDHETPRLKSAVMRLTREVRMSVPPTGTAAPAAGVARNPWAGWPAVAGLAPYVVLRLTVEGTPDPTTGYLLNIKAIDRRLRDAALPALQQAGTAGRGQTPERLIAALWGVVGEPFANGARPIALEMNLTPYLRYSMSSTATREVSLTQSFEFSASHRLYSPGLSDAENARVFGKCANPSGHGHNYQVDVTLSGRADERTGVLVRLEDFEATVIERVINRFDHKHLNADCPEFAAVNPSVENITRTIWGLLEGAFGAARLANVRVWETPKTWADYSG
jgi:6-pyruvoyltetrahydropterin/6-carboxytetrahydropterin synthase